MASHRRAVPRLSRWGRSDANGGGWAMVTPGEHGVPEILSDHFMTLKSLVCHLQRQRRLDADELYRSKERFQALVDNLPLKVFVKDASARYVACNSLFALDLGLTPAQVVGRNDFDFYPAHDAERFLREDSRVIGSGDRLSAQESVCQDGLEKIVHIIKAPFHDAHGEVAGIIGAILDITGSRQVERRLRQFAYEVEDLYQDAPCAYQTLDATGVIRRINNTALAWLGCRREEIIGRVRLEEVLSETSRRRFADVFPEFVKSGKLPELALDLVRKDGCLLPVSLQATAEYDDEGSFVACNLVFSDIAAQREMAREQGLQQRYLEALKQQLAAARVIEPQRLANELQSRALSNLMDVAHGLATLNQSLPGDVRNKYAEQFAHMQRLIGETTAGIADILAEHIAPNIALAAWTAQAGNPLFERRRQRGRRQTDLASACSNPVRVAGWVERRSGVSRRSQDWQQASFDWVS